VLHEDSHLRGLRAPSERLADAARRVLREKTGIILPPGGRVELLTSLAYFG
jgi:DUF1365 family protein